jgi:hypothetical protein
MGRKVPQKLINLLRKLADNAERASELTKLILEECERIQIDTDSDEFAIAFGYIEGDYDISPIIEYIESEGE